MTTEVSVELVASMFLAEESDKQETNMKKVAPSTDFRQPTSQKTDHNSANTLHASNGKVWCD
jgi:hypothetical protein